MTLPNPYSTEPDEVDTTLCATCGQPSSFVDARPGANPVGYCAADLPPQLSQVVASGDIQATGAPSDGEDVVEAPEPTPEQELDDAAEKASTKVAKAATRR